MKQKHGLVKQDYRLVNARYKVSTNEQKLILFAVSALSENDPDDNVYSIKISELGHHLDNESLKNKHTRLKEFCESLLRKPIYIPDDTGGFLVANWFSSLRYVPGAGELRYRISTELKPYLLDLRKRFVQYNLGYILPLSSTYSIRVYQLLKEYEKIGKREFPLEELQNILGVPQSMKVLYSNFKLRVLTVAHREINIYTDISFDYDEIKSGKKVVSLRFIIKSAQAWNDCVENEDNRLAKFLEHVPNDFKKDARKVILRFMSLKDDVIISNIRLTNCERRDSYAAFLTSALKNDYAVNNRDVIEALEVEDLSTSEEGFIKLAKLCFNSSWMAGKKCSRGDGVHIRTSDKRCIWCAKEQLNKYLTQEFIDALILK